MRIRMLVQGVETCSGGALRCAPVPGAKAGSRQGREAALHLLPVVLARAAPARRPAPPRGTLNLNPAVEQFQMLVTNWVNRSDGTVQWQPGMEVHVRGMKRKDAALGRRGGRARDRNGDVRRSGRRRRRAGEAEGRGDGGGGGGEDGGRDGEGKQTRVGKRPRRPRVKPPPRRKPSERRKRRRARRETGRGGGRERRGPRRTDRRPRRRRSRRGRRHEIGNAEAKGDARDQERRGRGRTPSRRRNPWTMISRVWTTVMSRSWGLAGVGSGSGKATSQSSSISLGGKAQGEFRVGGEKMSATVPA